MDIQRGSSIRGTYAAAEKKTMDALARKFMRSSFGCSDKKKHLWMKGDVLQVGIQQELRHNGI